MNITIVGYGIQGRAQALNLRDSGNDVVIVNREDSYAHTALQDGFEILPMVDALKRAEVVFLLIPDAVQDEILKGQIFPNLCAGTTLVFAHGYWLTYERESLPNDINVLMMAPRFPGEQIRQTFVEGGGVPVYVDVVQDVSESSEQVLESLCKDLGYAAGGVINLSYKQETEIDLFIEQFMAPTFFASAETAFQLLVEKGYPKEAVCLELYYSGELGAVRSMMGRNGLYKGFQDNASPTCQYGVASGRKLLWGSEMRDKASMALERITSGNFSSELSNQNLSEQTLDNFVNSDLAKQIKATEKDVNKLVKKFL